MHSYLSTSSNLQRPVESYVTTDSSLPPSSSPVLNFKLNYGGSEGEGEVVSNSTSLVSNVPETQLGFTEVSL